ncbi:MAG TPA: hypothetical protein EYN74_04270, partial [Nitrospirales bacterium]|nr:hypothetical protein [Nitrospirales bacterium]
MTTQAEVSETYQLETENRQLKETILLLRQQVEEMRIDKEQSIQHATNARANEIAQLHDTIHALRNTLEAEQSDKERSIQAAEANSSREIAQ